MRFQPLNTYRPANEIRTSPTGRAGAGVLGLVASGVVGELEVDDPTHRTLVLEGISEVFGQLNRVRATLQSRRTELLSVEGTAEFAAQFRLLDQAVTSALSLAAHPLELAVEHVGGLVFGHTLHL